MSNNYMSTNERIATANLVLEHAFKAASNAQSTEEISAGLTEQQLTLLKTVLLGNHVTYRYILLTALTAKCADPSINILSLQKKDTSVGAYDARSIAHKVVVPFERQYLHEALGGSNEPFLNKPARFPSLSKDNAVRRGADRAKLEMLVDVLPTFNSQTITIALNTALYMLNSKQSLGNDAVKQEVDTSGLSVVAVSNSLHALNSTSLEGQTLPLSCAILLKRITSTMSGKFKIEIHKVNQAGSSSKEVEDIDIYKDGKLYYALEAKDKEFSVQDVQHSIEKVAAAGLSSLTFIYGNNVTPNDVVLNDSQKIANNLGIYLNIQPYDAFESTVLGLTSPYTTTELDDDLYDFANEARMTDIVFSTIKDLF